MSCRSRSRSHGLRKPCRYAWIHKHHHQQHVPTNGIEDAINEHPFEYLVGEYIHLLAIAIVSCTIGLHAYSVAVFAIAAAFLPALNHTRMDIVIPGFYRSKHHDQHHVLPKCVLRAAARWLLAASEPG